MGPAIIKEGWCPVCRLIGILLMGQGHLGHRIYQCTLCDTLMHIKSVKSVTDSQIEQLLP